MEPEAITDTYSVCLCLPLALPSPAYRPAGSPTPPILRQLLFKREFLDRALKSAAYCKSKFGYDAASTLDGNAGRRAVIECGRDARCICVVPRQLSACPLSTECRPCNSLQCADVLLFWRLHNMLDATVNMLRLEAMDYKRELQEDIRDVLNRISIDEEAKIRLISGKRVVLAEEIEVLRHLQSKLEQFTKQLKKEGKLR